MRVNLHDLTTETSTMARKNSAGNILVTGATGAQGGATARRLLAQGWRVRFLTRDPDSPVAQSLLAQGAEASKGEFEDRASVAAAMQDIAAVFSVQLSGARERQQGFLLIEEARRAGVPQFVHTSVTGTASHTRMPLWGSGYWGEEYWSAKRDIEEAVRSAGFESYTVLRPAFMMENFIAPKVRGMFPDLRRQQIASAMHGDTRLQLVSAEDVGRFAAAALADPQRFGGHSIDLAAEEPSIHQIAATLSRALARSIEVVELTPEQALQRGQSSGWVRSQEWINQVGYHADIEALAVYGLPLTRLEDWAAQRRETFEFD